MQETYLNLDSHGILPADLESRTEYLIKGNMFLEYNDNVLMKIRNEEYISRSVKDFNNIKEATASNEVYEFMKQKYDADMRWVPYYVGNNKRSWALGYCVQKFYGKIKLPSVVVGNKSSKSTNVHEFLHSIRSQIENYDKKDKVMVEMMAEDNSFLPIHSEFIWHPLQAIKTYVQIMSVKGKFNNCFSAKADYAIVRLTKNEIEELSREDVDEYEVKRYFQERATVSKRCGLPSALGELRFSIMCEKLGL